MRNRKLRILSAATALTVMFAAHSSALSVSAFENGQSVGIGNVTSSSNQAISGENSGLEYSTAVIAGNDGKNHSVKTITFNPETSDYIPLVYSQYSGFGSRTIRAAENAESKHGYDVKAGVNASFFVLSGGDISGSTYGGVNISDGKVYQGCNNYGPTWMLTFDSDGKSDLVYSRVAYELKLNGEVKRDALENININPTSGKTTTGIYYWDTGCGTATDTKEPGVEIVFNKIDDTELLVGGTLLGEVCEIRSNVSSGNPVAYNQFVLYASDKSQWASDLRGLKIGDRAEITCTETIADAKTAMENCNGALVTYGYHLVEDGKNIVSSFPLGDAFSKERAQRTAIGIKEDGSLLVFVCDGRTTDYPGMTLYELADFLIAQGCVTGIDLDGGGSTQMTIENVSGTLEEAMSSTRGVANSLLIVKRPEISHNLVAPKREKLQSLISIAESAGLSSLVAYGESVYNSATSMPGDYTKAIMALQEEIGRIIVRDLPSTALGLIGSPLTLSIEASPIGGGTLSYQWYKDDAAIEGATGPSYTIDSVVESDAGKYQVIVTNTISEESTTAYSTVCTLEVSDGNNIVEGLKYTTSLRDGGANAGLGDFHDDHPDVERVKLTDGLYSSSWSDSNSVGYNARNWEPVDITFHLGDTPKTFQQINIGAFSPNANGIQLQSNTKIEIKNGADDDWHVICNSPTAGSLGVDKRFVFATEQGKSVQATDIRFILELGSSWLFLDEIEILRNGDGSTPDDVLTAPAFIVETPSFTADLESDRSVQEGTVLTLSVAAAVSDGGTLSYQWYKDEQAIAGATSASYTIKFIQKSDEGSYKVVVTNTLNGEKATASSSVCAVTVETAVEPVKPVAPTFTTNLESSRQAKAGDSITLAVEAAVSDGGTLSYQWYKDDQAIAGATSTSYTINSIQKSDEGSYKVVATNTLNGEKATASSNICVITVEAPAEPNAPTFTTNLSSAKSAQVGDVVTFSVKAVSNSGGALSYQWYKNGSAIAEATGDSYTIASASLFDGGVYYVDVTDESNGTHTLSNSCTLTVSERDIPSGGGSSGGWGGGSTSRPDVIVGDWEQLSDGSWQYVEDNQPVTGWKSIHSTWYYFNSDGIMVTGWFKDGGYWYYLKSSGAMATDWVQVDGNWYYLKDDGRMATGWLKLGSVWYYLKSSGVMATGWLQEGSTWYYLYDWGGMANTSWVQVNGSWYYFRGNGAMTTGWLQLGSTWYYLKSSGAMATRWNWIGNNCYYFNQSGKMAANTTVGGYKLDAAGTWVK